MLKDDFKRRAEEARRERENMGTYRPASPAPLPPPPRPVQSAPPLTPRKRVRYKFSLVRLLLIFAILAGLIWGGYKLIQNFSLSDFQFLNRGTSVEDLVEEVGKLVELPAGEEPTVATITDLEPLRGQAFFADARVGDKVLIFGQSKKAILYRPSEKRIIVIAPLNQ